MKNVLFFIASITIGFAAIANAETVPTTCQSTAPHLNDAQKQRVENILTNGGRVGTALDGFYDPSNFQTSDQITLQLIANLTGTQCQKSGSDDPKDMDNYSHQISGAACAVNSSESGQHKIIDAHNESFASQESYNVSGAAFLSLGGIVSAIDNDQDSWQINQAANGDDDDWDHGTLAGQVVTSANDIIHFSGNSVSHQTGNSSNSHFDIYASMKLQFPDFNAELELAAPNTNFSNSSWITCINGEPVNFNSGNFLGAKIKAMNPVAHH